MNGTETLKNTFGMNSWPYINRQYFSISGNWENYISP